MLLFTTAQKGWSRLLTHGIMETAKALGGSFKLVMLTPRTVREMTQPLREAVGGGGGVIRLHRVMMPCVN